MTECGPKQLPTPADFFECAIWRYNDEDDLYYPVLTGEQMPESERDLSIRAVFSTPAGQELDGYVVGISRVFSMGLFGRDVIYNANKNLRALSEEWMQGFISERAELGPKSLSDIFPLKYTTQINRPGYHDFSGVFDLYS